MKNNSVSRCLLLIIFMVVSVHFLNAQRSKNIISLKREKPVIELGESTTIHWSVKKAQKVWMKDNDEPLDLSGSMEVMPIETTKYTFYAKKGRKTYSKTTKITVLKPEIISFGGSSVVRENKEGFLEWQARNCSYVQIVGIADSLPASGRISISPTQSGSYRLIAVNNYYNKATADFQVSVQYDEYVKAPPWVTQGNEAVISWRFMETEKVTIAPVNLEFNSTDSLVFKPAYTQTYTIRVFRKDGHIDTFEQTVEVRNRGIKYFSGDNCIWLGDQATLSWRTFGCDKTVIRELGVEMPPEGTCLVQPDSTATFTLEAWYGDEKYEQTFKVRVIQREYVYNGIINATKVSKGQRIDFVIFAVDDSKKPQEIKLYVLAVDEKGNFVSGLAPPNVSDKQCREYFLEIIERQPGKKPYTLKNFKVIEVNNSSESGERDISLVMDYSGSMAASIGTLETACQLFIKNKNPKDRISFVRFDDSLALELPLTQSAEKILNTLTFYGLKDFGGATALYAGADLGLHTLSDQKRNKEMILFTDGYENSSLVYDSLFATSGQEFAQNAIQNSTRVSAVCYGPSVNTEILQKISNMTGGMLYSIENPQEISKVMKEMEIIRNNYYVITYKPVYSTNEVNVTLIYNNNQTGRAKANRTIIYDKTIDISELDFDTTISYWKEDTLKLSGYIPVSVPQIVAHFDFDEYVLKPEDFSKIDFFVDYMKKNKEVIILIAGHTDKVGSENACYILAYRRADAVKSYMITAGVEPSRIVLIGCGKDYPVWTTEDEDWKAAENRRVEVMFLKK